MRSKLIRLIALLAMMVCLPLQGLAAVAMPACQMHGQLIAAYSADTMDASMDMSHCAHDQHAKSDHQQGKSVCEKCSACYLSLGQAIGTSVPRVGVIAVASKFTAEIAVIPDSFLSSLFRPPRPVLAQR